MSWIHSVVFPTTSFYQGETNYNPESMVKFINFSRSTEAGENFQLLVFVNDVDQAVTEGNDGVEHM